MPASTQVKLLRVLEDKSFFRVGGTQPIKVDVRVIAATNKSVKEAVELGRFRDDLFYRLNVLSVYLPPLRERRSDIPLLVRTFVAEFAKTHARTFRGITPEATQILVEADWPGNVRQLKNLIESMVVLAPEGEIRASDIPRDIRERTRTMPVRIAEAQGVPREITGQELEFIFRTLVEMKVQLEELRRRIEERAPERVEVIEVGGSREQGAGTRRLEPATVDPLDSTPEPDGPVVYKSGVESSGSTVAGSSLLLPAPCSLLPPTSITSTRSGARSSMRRRSSSSCTFISTSVRKINSSSCPVISRGAPGVSAIRTGIVRVRSRMSRGMSLARISPSGASTTIDSMRFLSWRTLPGQSAATRICVASGVMPRNVRACVLANSATNVRTSKGMSLRRSRRGGR